MREGKRRQWVRASIVGDRKKTPQAEMYGEAHLTQKTEERYTGNEMQSPRGRLEKRDVRPGRVLKTSEHAALQTSAGEGRLGAKRLLRANEKRSH